MGGRVRGKGVDLLRHHCHCDCRRCHGPTTTTPYTQHIAVRAQPVSLRSAPPKPRTPKHARRLNRGTGGRYEAVFEARGSNARPGRESLSVKKQLCARQPARRTRLFATGRVPSYKRSFWTSDGFVCPTWLNACSKRDCFAAGILLALDFLGGMVSLGTTTLCGYDASVLIGNGSGRSHWKFGSD